MLYRLNIFYKNFELQGKADVILVYLMSFISECLNALPRSTAKTPLTKQVCLKTFQNQVQLTLELPGSYNFNLGMVFDAPKDEREREACRSYFIHLRNECAKRLADEVFDRENSNGEMSKWWKCFQKRKFMYNYGK
jgi:actin related protein 2/3 complex subunit 3